MSEDQTKSRVEGEQVLEEKLSQALAELEQYKRKLDATTSVLEEAEELVEFTWDQVESAEDLARAHAEAKARAVELEREKDRLEKQALKMKKELNETTSRAYIAEQALSLREEQGREDFERALELSIRKAKRYDRGLAVLVFPLLDEEGEIENIIDTLRDSDFFSQLDDSSFGVIIEEDLPHHDIGESIERLSERIDRLYGSSLYGVDAVSPTELLDIAKEAMEAEILGP